MPTSILPTTAAKEWDDVRTDFASSIMVDTALSSLAQNLDGLTWPFSGADETPSTYLDFTYDELCAEFEGREKPSATNLLIQILQETLSFDQPFGEMAKQTEASSQRDNPLLRTLTRLQIPEDFPIGLTALDEDTRELCRLEKVETIGQLALFAQNVSQNVIVGGEFRELLNALAHVDEQVLARFVPLRSGRLGLHLMEALIHASRSADPSAQAARAIEWFKREADQWQRESAVDRKFLLRQLVVITDPALQEEVAKLIVPHFVTPTPRTNKWSSITRWFKA